MGEHHSKLGGLNGHPKEHKIFDTEKENAFQMRLPNDSIHSHGLIFTVGCSSRGTAMQLQFKARAGTLTVLKSGRHVLHNE
ncbi:MAG: hypothetical protein C4519_22155 [Desulfobacteraceae bacterium]|nr:MAG: hypothetical protein C4519_22155 [Desulfobacteraceae bacterium]